VFVPTRPTSSSAIRRRSQYSRRRWLAGSPPQPRSARPSPSEAASVYRNLSTLVVHLRAAQHRHPESPGDARTTSLAVARERSSRWIPKTRSVFEDAPRFAAVVGWRDAPRLAASRSLPKFARGNVATPPDRATPFSPTHCNRDRTASATAPRPALPLHEARAVPRALRAARLVRGLSRSTAGWRAVSQARDRRGARLRRYRAWFPRVGWDRRSR